jgi:hypothetical protein
MRELLHKICTYDLCNLKTSIMSLLSKKKYTVNTWYENANGFFYVTLESTNENKSSNVNIALNDVYSALDMLEALKFKNGHILIPDEYCEAVAYALLNTVINALKYSSVIYNNGSASTASTSQKKLNHKKYDALEEILNKD